MATLESRAVELMQQLGSNLHALLPADTTPKTRAEFEQTLRTVISTSVSHAALQAHLLQHLARLATPIWTAYATTAKPQNLGKKNAAASAALLYTDRAFEIAVDKIEAGVAKDAHVAFARLLARVLLCWKQLSHARDIQ